MKAYVVKTGVTIEPFGDPVGESYLGGRTLESAVKQAFEQSDVTLEYAASSGEVPLKGDYLLLPDNLFLTRRCIRSFLQGSQEKSKPSRLALVRGPASDYALPLQEAVVRTTFVEYDLFRIRGIELPRGMNWPQIRDFLADRSQGVLLDPQPQIELLPQSFPGKPRPTVELPRTTLMAADVRHWVHILWLNHQLPWVRLQEYWEDHPGLKRAWRSRGKNPHRKAIRLSVLGENCDIHPTARIEGSLIGNRVKMGPDTSARDCILGDDVEIASHSKFLRCVVGNDCHTLNDSYFIGCTFYPGSTLANFGIRNSVLGRDSFMTSGAMFWAEVTSPSIEVTHQGTKVPTGRCDLGGCSGHNTLLGARAIFLAGSSVPNRTITVMRPGEGVFKMPASVDPNDPYICHQGGIANVREVYPDFSPGELE